MQKSFFVSGIGTEIGKTVCSAILVKALATDYWKPVQSGDLHHSDSDKVAAWNDLSLPHPRFHPEAYRLQTPMSPHAAAAIDGIRIELDQFRIPSTGNTLIVEGAGGLMVPLNEQDTLLDLMRQLQIPVILVSRNYLGSINHTLLSIAQLRQAKVPLAGIVFNGPPTPSTEEIILKMTDIPLLFRIPVLDEVSSRTIAALAETEQDNLRKALSI